jgi:hypothetical protein
MPAMSILILMQGAIYHFATKIYCNLPGDVISSDIFFSETTGLKSKP